MGLFLGVTALHWVNEELALNTDLVMAKDTKMETTVSFLSMESIFIDW